MTLRYFLLLITCLTNLNILGSEKQPNCFEGLVLDDLDGLLLLGSSEEPVDLESIALDDLGSPLPEHQPTSYPEITTQMAAAPSNPNTCTFCGKTFRHACHLQVHIRAHTGEKPYQCNTCGKCFSQEGNRQQHMLIHIGEKLHQCNNCPKSFISAKGLDRHMLIHTDETPYTCTTCNQSFRCPVFLKNHKCKKHNQPQITAIESNNKTTYQCSDCKRLFTNPRNLRHHMRIHTGETPYTCTTCNQSFRWPAAFKRHMRLHTGKEHNPLQITTIENNDDDAYTMCSACGKMCTATELGIHQCDAIDTQLYGECPVYEESQPYGTGT